jgi:hypothetical protein
MACYIDRIAGILLSQRFSTVKNAATAQEGYAGATVKRPCYSGYIEEMVRIAGIPTAPGFSTEVGCPVAHR